MAKVEKTPVSNLNDNQRKRLTEIISAGVVSKTQVAIYTESFNELVKEGAEELNIEASDIKEAINTIFKQNYHEKTEKQDRIDTILSITGNMSIASGEE